MPPLVSIPESEIDIAGETYMLSYDPEEGFRYVSDAGDGIQASGSGTTPIEDLRAGYEALGSIFDFLPCL